MERRDSAGLVTLFAPEEPVAGESMTLGEGTAHHARVRRLQKGTPVRLLDGAGHSAAGSITRIARRMLAVNVQTVSMVEPPPPVHLIVPVADRDRMLWLAEKSVELGATSWRPVAWQRSRSVSPRGEGPNFRFRMRARMIAALEQSGSTWLPAVYPESRPENAIAAAPEGVRVLLDAGGDPVLAAALSSVISPPITLAIGPEGGLEAEERALFTAAGFVPARLADGVLRFETAAIAALALARAVLDTGRNGSWETIASSAG
ncbi:MAG: RsmE family RNA methyltransferase [Gemmatimonadaceae bacterium]